MKWLKLFVFVIYCALLYLVMYKFPHENAVSIHNQVQFLSIGSIGAFVIVVVAIVIAYGEKIRSTRLSASFNMFFLTFRASGPFDEAASSFRAREGALIDRVRAFIVFVQIFS